VKLLRAAAGLAAATAVLTGCGGLATESPVQQGLDVGSVQENEVRVEANPVAPGSSPEQVVLGFIRAAAASDDQYQVARSYLAPSAQDAWRPDSSVVVFTDETALAIAATVPGSVRAVAKATARIDGNGVYQELPPSSTVPVTFSVQRIAGEWRISGLPEGFGTWLSEADVERLYDPFNLYFLAATERRLVPDVRWYPVGTGLATRLARGLLSGVPAYLKGAVRSDVPQGTRLAVDSVPIDSGTARVNLTAIKLTSDPGQRQSFGAQFLATVDQAAGVDRVALQLEGTELQVPGANDGGSLSSLAALGFGAPPEPSSKPLLRNGSTLVAVDPLKLTDRDEQVPADRSTWPALPVGWAFPALSWSGAEVAAVSGDRRQVARWRGTTQVQLLDVGTRLSPPTYDRHNVLWVAGREGDRTRVWAVNTAAGSDDAASRPKVVTAAWLDNRSVGSIRLSPDGQRVAVYSTDRAGKDLRVDVAGVVREPNGLPRSLAEPLNLAPALTLVRDLVWVDESTLAVLGRKASSQVIRPWFVPLGGPISAGPEIAGAVSITTVNGERGLVVTSDRHVVQIRAGNRWQDIGNGSAFLVPGR
jgi:hypothetical protein